MDILDKISLKIQRGNWKPYIEERQTIQWPKEDRQYNGQKKKEQNINIHLQSTTHKTKSSFNGQLILNLWFLLNIYII
jgi:hypothetical protein